MALGITDPNITAPSSSLELVTYFLGGTPASPTYPRPATVIKTGLGTQRFTVDMNGRFIYYVDGSGNLMRWDSSNPSAVDVQLRSQSQIGDTLTWLEITLDNSALICIGASNKVYKVITAAPYTVSVLAGTGGQGNADGAGSSASFNNLHTLFLDQTTGTVAYTFDNTTGSVRTINVASGVVATLGSGIGIPPGNLLKSKSGTFYALSNERMTVWVPGSGSNEINLVAGSYTNPGTIDDGEPGSYFLYFLLSATGFTQVHRYEIATGIIVPIATLPAPAGSSNYNDGSRIIYRTPALYLADLSGNLIQIQG